MKGSRQARILEIISTMHIETQEELMRALRESGFDATQATVSRDIKDLRLIKAQNTNGEYRYTVASPETVQSQPKFVNLFRDAVYHIEAAQNLVVIKCHVGMAQAACAAVDSQKWESLVGTLAGDDTFLCITHTAEEAADLAEQLNQLRV